MRARCYIVELMENVFTRSWSLARQGAQRFGGRASDYFACALRLTYVAIRKAAQRSMRPVNVLARVARVGLSKVTVTCPQLSLYNMSKMTQTMKFMVHSLMATKQQLGVTPTSQIVIGIGCLSQRQTGAKPMSNFIIPVLLALSIGVIVADVLASAVHDVQASLALALAPHR